MVTTGVFLILVAKAPTAVWKVHRSARGAITNIEKKREYVYHYSFHIMDPAFGHLTVKMSGHPPFGAQVMLNGHEYVAVAAQAEGIGLRRRGTADTKTGSPVGARQRTLAGAEARGEGRRWLSGGQWPGCRVGGGSDAGKSGLAVTGRAVSPPPAG